MIDWIHDLGRKQLAASLGLGLGLLLPATTAGAAGDADAGGRLTQQWCTSCHVADGTAGTDAAPPLPELLRGQQRTSDQLRGWLADPHPPMPKLELSRQEIEDVVAYLEQLAQP